VSDRYLGAQHGSVTANGTPVSPGQSLPASAIDPNDPHDQHLLEDGLIIDTKPGTKRAAPTPQTEETD
jgi:hypothetical protein